MDRVDLIFRPGRFAHGQMAALLPETLELVSPSAARDSGTAMIRAYQLNLSVLSFASLFVGMFLVYSLVALNAASRRRELAVMRSLGASPRLLFRLFLEIFDETFAVTTVLLFIALAVAALGITTTLSVLVLERSRQLNTIAAVGASSGQIRAMIFWEAAFLVAAGEIAGLACGFMLSYLLVYVINRQSFGWTFLYTVDWGALALSLPLIVLTALAAAVPAVRMVFREPPATLLRER